MARQSFPARAHACEICWMSIFDSSMNSQDRQFESARSENSVARFFRLIRFSHTVFALPFALGALVVAANGWPSPRILLLVVVCMVCARTAAMLFNRLIDWSLDQRNPRTASRHLLLSKSTVTTLLAISSVGFIAGAAAINRLTFLLSPVALVAIALVYEHRSARALDVAGVNRAFFQTNAFVSAVFLIAVCLDRLF